MNWYELVHISTRMEYQYMYDEFGLVQIGVNLHKFRLLQIFTFLDSPNSFKQERVDLLLRFSVTIQNASSLVASETEHRVQARRPSSSYRLQAHSPDPCASDSKGQVGSDKEQHDSPDIADVSWEWRFLVLCRYEQQSEAPGSLHPSFALHR